MCYCRACKGKTKALSQLLGEAEVLFDFSQAFVKRRWSHFSGGLRQVVSCFVRLWAGVVHCFILRFLRSVTDSCLLFA